MKPSQITQIIIRLFAISWFLHGIVQTVGVLTMSNQRLSDPILFLPGVIAFVLSIAAWFLAQPLGQIICRGNDKEEIISGISFQQILNTMFIGIGLYFCASSLGGLLNGIHFFVVLKATPESIPSGMELSLYDFTRPAISFLAGAFLVGSGRFWSNKITNK